MFKKKVKHIINVKKKSYMKIHFMFFIFYCLNRPYLLKYSN